MWDSDYQDLLAQSHRYLAWLSTLTLGQIFTAVYNPPTKLNLTLLVIAICFKVPERAYRLSQWRLSRRAQRFEWPKPEQANPQWSSRVIENPALSSHEQDVSLLPQSAEEGSAVKYITSYDPSTGYHIETIPLLSAEAVSLQIEKAHQLKPYWQNTSFATRTSLIRSLKQWVLDDMDGIVRVACRDTGKTRVDAVFGEILVTLAKMDWLIKHGEKALQPETRPNNLLTIHKVSKVHYKPLGLALALVSWNYSFHNLISPILAALFSGNTVVVKCSEQVAWSSRWYIGGIKQCLKAMGLNEDVVQLVVCLPDVAETITRNPHVNHVTFIGSEPVGKLVAAAAAEIMVPTCIELGGKDPAFLLPDVRLETWVRHLMRGTYQSSGQNCIGIELVLVPRHLQSRLISLILPRVKALRPGVDVGSLISSQPIAKLESIIAEAEGSGAKLLCGGRRHQHPAFPQASYFQPTLLTDVTFDMAVAQNELFAPVMSIIPYDSVDEVIQHLNNSRFGLGAGVYGENKAECERVAQALECGMVSINDFGVFYLNQALPFGGAKASGHGRFAGPEGLRGLCYPKSVVHDRFFSWIRTSIPPVVDFPLPNPEVSWQFLTGLTGFAHGTSLVQRAKGLWGLLSSLVKA